ncbi:heparin and heparin-sulfate lyase precursor [Duganella sp. HH105]|nr:heparin and heparin-sulfate lyase precursor [Duganella sp. HH105]
MRSPAICSMAMAIAIAFSSSAFALPGAINSAHPRLYATQTDIDRLRNVLPIDVPVLPATGTITFKISAARKAAGDGDHAVLFGTTSSATNAVLLRHIDSWDSASGLGVQLGFIVAGDSSYAANARFTLEPDVETPVILTYDSVLKRVTLLVNGKPTPINYNSNGFKWTPGSQRYDFVGRRGDVVKDFKLFDGADKLLWQRDHIDYELGAAYTAFMTGARQRAATIRDTCVVQAEPPENGSVCDVAIAGRNVILEEAKELALAYKLSGEPALLNAARKYVDMILAIRDYPKAGLTAGTEWSMNARIAALGVIYDWFFSDLDEAKRKAMRVAIRDTIRADIPGSNNDLIGMTCGGMALSISQAVLDCAGKPDLSNAYIMGHQASAMTGTALALLPIVDDSADDGVDVRPLIDRIYTHLVDGLIPARDYISIDGGHHTLFSYGSTVGEMVERLIMWRRALRTQDGSAIAPSNFESNVVRPFIYALRSDGSFPAEGDNFELDIRMPYVGYAALAAANRGDGVAITFYQKNIKEARGWGRSSQLIWDTLYFPDTPAAPVDISTLPLSARFRVAGNVFMRDSWDYTHSTLLDFKSTSFTSENHQHLDQNSFSVFRHAPLLIDSGVYDAYNSAHWNNYYSRTIAHNSVLVFDPAEQFILAGKPVSNDGGQWFKASQPPYPALADILPGGRNALGGVTQFEDGVGYAFVTGDASKAYSSKLDQQDGFLRSIFYLRPATTGGKTSILVFDRLHAPGLLAATSLLHTVNKPVAHATATADAGGRLKLQPAPDNFPLMVRNGDGMVTVEPLLPKNARVTLVGSQPGIRCSQVMTDSKQTVVDADCRFTVRAPTGNGAFAWSNYGPNTVFDKKSQSDFGVWRMEISAVDDGLKAPGAYQWFLNVLHVEDQRAEADPTVNSSVLLDSSDGSAAAVAVEPDVTVVFAKSSAPASSLRWKAASNYHGAILAAGLVPSTIYVRSYDIQTQEIVLTASAAAAGGSFPRASRDGVLSIPAN